MAAAVARFGIEQMARQFIIGSDDDLDEVLARLGRRWEAGFASTLDLLGEKTFTAREADHYAARVSRTFLRLIDTASRWPSRPVLERDPWGPLGRVNVSVKPTALAPKMHVLTEAAGVAQAVERLGPILDVARQSGATVHIDAEHDETKDATHALLRAIGEQWPDGPALGCVVQAYRQDAADDLAALVRWSGETLDIPLQVRLVKGAYWDAETIVARANGWPNPLFEQKPGSDASFEACAQDLAAGAADGAVRPAFASHNIRSLAAAITACRQLGLGDDAFEIQVLHGMAEPLHHGLRDLGFRVRVYSPMGDLIPGMSYLVRRLLENTANESFVAQGDLRGAALDAAIGDPATSPVPVARRETDPLDHDSQDRRTEEATMPSHDPTATFRNEPVAELRRAPVRARFASAVSAVESTLGFDVSLLIAGRAVSTKDTLPSVDPGRTSRTVAVQSLADGEHVHEAMAAATGALAGWSSRSVHERAEVLRRGADLLRRRRGELAALIAIEAGKPIAEADADVCEAIDFWGYYAASAEAA